MSISFSFEDAKYILNHKFPVEKVLHCKIIPEYSFVKTDSSIQMDVTNE
jgi:hypothetical protein